VHRSLAVFLSTGGAPLDAAALGTLPGGRIVRMEFAWGGRTSCAAATVEHDGPGKELLAAVKPWAAARGWSVAIAPAPGSD
jgi:hypothetical protein